MTERLERGRDAIRTGDAAALATLLDDDADLVHARCADSRPPYDGYFHRATLLHHVSGNPAVTPVPPNAVALATLLLDRGADVDALTDQGPSQPDDIRWTTLGLVATSLVAREAGVQAALIDLLVDRGADLDARNGGPLIGALYYAESAAAEQLVRMGARVDLIAAAGLGRPDLVERFVDQDGALHPDAHRLVHYALVPLPEHVGRQEILDLALVYAAKQGHPEVAERLVALGADVNARPPFDHRATPLHWAVLGDRPACVRWLLENGADLQAQDTSFRSTPLGWAQHFKRPEIVRLIEAADR